jgi:hypothetical protein
VIGPDGSAMVHVHCGFDQAACFRIAGELCPSGYEMKPVLSGNDGNFLVRCRSAALVSAAASCPAVAPPTPTPSPTHNLAFAAPPLAATSAAFNAAPVSTASPSGQEIDLGY